MTTRYHISPSTGNPNKCSAKEGNCPFKSEEGVETPHYGSKEEARAGYEQQQADKAAAIKREQEEKREREWPTPSQDAAAAVELRNPNYVTARAKKILDLEETVAGDRKLRVTVSSGDLAATLSDERRFGSTIRISRRFNFKGDEVQSSYETEFSDHGTTLSLDDAKEHLKSMEKVIAVAPSLVEKSNAVLKDAEELYGRPHSDTKAVRDFPLYGEVPSMGATLTPATPTKESFQVKEEGPYEGIGKLYDYTSDEDVDNWSRRFKPELRTQFNGKTSATINMAPESSMSFQDYQKRADKLRHAIVTLEAMQEDYRARVRNGG